MKKNTLIRFLVSFLLVGLIVFLFRNSFDEIWQTLKESDFKLFIILFVAWVFMHFFFALRLKIVLAVQETRLPLWDVYSVVLAGMFFNNFIPSSVGGGYC